MKPILAVTMKKMKTIRTILVDGYDIEIDQELIDHLPQKRVAMEASLPLARRVLRQFKVIDRETKKAAKKIERRHGDSGSLSDILGELNEVICSTALFVYGNPQFLAMQEKAAIAYKAGKGRRRKVHQDCPMW